MMDAFLTFGESFVAGSTSMEWDCTEVHVEEMEWDSCEGDEPMDWEEIPEVRYAKKSKASESLDIKTNFTFQHTTTSKDPNKVSKPVIPNTTFPGNKTAPAEKKVSLPVDAKKNFPVQVPPTPSQPKAVSPPANSEIIRRKIRTKPKVSPPQWKRWSTPTNQRRVRAPPVAERRSSSNWEMKIVYSYTARSSSGRPRGVSLVPQRVTRMWAGYP
ncbi:hypothetical protein NPIL_531611 [Nephila pilipes]|uniref:Uncharacterized protein n=1 Tax=Nephila pilipes TaxID=299642 RepID=A0A8X6PJ84_NEPPI|nr:hypothetical protein NPIL_531611 [Nephila pilipes]